MLNNYINVAFSKSTENAWVNYAISLAQIDGDQN